MKKLLLIASSILLFSCSTNDEVETKSLSVEKITAFENAKKNPNPGETITFKCGSTSYINPINVNPAYPYISNYEVLFWEGTPMHGRNQRYLTTFIAEAIWPSSGPAVSLTQVFTGYSTQNDFLLAGSGSIEEYTYGQDEDNAAFYGDIFPNSGPMTNDAANTVYHHFLSIINQKIAQGKTITAVHLYATSLLCIPSAKFVRMSIKVQ